MRVLFYTGVALASIAAVTSCLSLGQQTTLVQLENSGNDTLKFIKPDLKSSGVATEALQEFNAKRVHPQLVDGKVPNPAGRDILMTRQKMDTRMEAIEAKRSSDAFIERATERLAKKRIDGAMAAKESHERFEDAERARREKKRALDRSENTQAMIQAVEKMSKTTLETVAKEQETQQKTIAEALAKQNEELTKIQESLDASKMQGAKAKAKAEFQPAPKDPMPGGKPKKKPEGADAKDKPATATTPEKKADETTKSPEKDSDKKPDDKKAEEKKESPDAAGTPKPDDGKKADAPKESTNAKKEGGEKK